MVNKLANETSPYLQQHKDNPVDWYPYGEEAFEKAKKNDKPLFISIGYSTCHWCHVMERESFTDEETAEFMNENFVNVKVDREEYPGIDKAYQEMFQMIHRRGGGWPLSVWAHPDGTPFYIGTYFPDESKHGMPSFMDVNKQLVDKWENDKDKLEQQGGRLSSALKSLPDGWKNQEGELSDDVFYKEIISLQQRFDGNHGGIGNKPKFPRVSAFRFLLQEGLERDLEEIVDYVRFTYHKMAKGGIYDQLGGGFARYSVDEQWLIPHFEKMLYDNGALIELGSEIATALDDGFIEFIVKDTIGWMAREMQSPDGPFYAALNAESEDRKGQEREGAFYVWQQEEMKEILGDDFELAKERYGVTEEGNYEDQHHPEIKGMNVLSVQKSIDQLGKEFDKDSDEIFERLSEIRRTLFEERSKRERPSTDTKLIVAWNCIAIKGLLRAAQLLEFDEAANLAFEALDFIIENQLTDDKIIRVYNPDLPDEKQVEGILDDYSFLIAALIEAWEYSDKWKYMELANKVRKLADELFYDEEDNVYYMNPHDSADLFNRILQITDDSMASGLGVMIGNLYKLGEYMENTELISRSEAIARKFTSRHKQYSGSMDALLMSATPFVRYPDEIVLINAEDTELQNSFFTAYAPNKLVYRWDGGKDDRPKWDVLENRTDVDEPTAYICRGQTCTLPMTSKDEVIEELSEN